MSTASTCQDCSRLSIRSLALRCPAFLREAGSLAKMVFATHVPSTWATSGASVPSEARAYRPIGRSIYCVLQVQGLSAERNRSSAPISDQAGVAASGRSYTPPDTIKRQAMRANLLASATATSFGGLRPRSAASQAVGLCLPLRTCLSRAVAPTMSTDRRAESPAFVIPPCLMRPPVE